MKNLIVQQESPGLFRIIQSRFFAKGDLMTRNEYYDVSGREGPTSRVPLSDRSSASKRSK